MSGQLSYSYQTPKGVAGGLFDISPYRIDSRVNGETCAGKMMFGMGAVQGDNPGVNALVPDAGNPGAQFEGIVMTGFTNQMDAAGKVRIFPLQTIGILRWGTAWGRVADGVTPVCGDPAYLIADGSEAGYFTNDGGDDNLAVNGRFIGGLGTGGVAPIELYNQNASLSSDLAALDARIEALEA
jgi:hypothetical protein